MIVTGRSRMRARTNGAATRDSTPSVFDTLLVRICALEYPPGTVLSEVALATEFGLSRTPIRQILQHLSVFKLVVAKNGIGTIVTDLSPTQIAELSQFRQQLALALESVADAGGFGAVADRFDMLLDETNTLLESPNVQAFAIIGMQIHENISNLVTNSEFKTVWDHLYYKHSRFAYRLMKTDWENCIKLQCGELEAFTYVLRNRGTSELAQLYREVIKTWSGYASAGPSFIFPSNVTKSLLDQSKIF